MENKSSIGSKFMTNGEECLDGWVGADGGEVKGGGVDFRALGSMRLRPSLSRLKGSRLRGLVRISAMLSLEVTFSMEIFPFWTLSRRKWCQISICLVRECRMGFLLRSMTPLLSQRTGISSRFMS
ncbi:hypothetical protein Tco_0381498 [Tanacetum coccineum]